MDTPSCNGAGTSANQQCDSESAAAYSSTSNSNINEYSSDDDVFKQAPRKLCKNIEQTNVKNNPISCKFCRNTFSHRGSCTRHESSCRSNPAKCVINFPCLQCKKSFNRKQNLERHLAIANSKGGCQPRSCKFCKIKFNDTNSCTQHENKCKGNIERGSKIFQCAHCTKFFNVKSNLKVHLKKCSSEKPQRSKSKTPCLIKNCQSAFYHKIDLIDHFSASHKNQINIKPKVIKTFPSIQEFQAWKQEEEEETFSYFISRKGQKSKTVKHFYCQHDGSGKLHSKRKTSRQRNLPSIKVGHVCIAKMKITVKDDKTVDVVYYPTHSHICKKEHRLHHGITPEMSKFIDEKLALNIPPAVVYDLVREHFLPVDRPEVHDTKAGNLTKGLVLARGRRRRIALRHDDDDARSVYLLASERIKKDNSVLVYKPLGAKVVHGPQGIDNLPNSKEDLFMFGFQTESQLDLMKRHGGKILIVDETHGTNQYKFQLLTVMVVDENHRGWPVAHLITNKSDSDTLQFFFQALQCRFNPENKISILNCVITDDDAAFIKAMTNGFSQTFTHLLCKWHVIKNWKEHLRSEVPKDLFNDMLSELKVIMNAKDPSSFVMLKECFQKKYEDNPDVSKFMKYLDQYYWNRPNKWAMCFRNFPHANVNTTGHLESFHNRLKTNFLKRRPNKRLDDLINLLYDIAWYDDRTRCREAKTGFAVQPQKILERHRKGLLLDDDVIVEQNPECKLWEMKSGSGNGTYFIVGNTERCEFEHCFTICKKAECHSLCSHLFSCSCPDHHPLCKHIHKLQSVLFRAMPHCPMEEDFYNFETAPNPVACEELNNNSNDNNECMGNTLNAREKRKNFLWKKAEVHFARLQEFMSQDRGNVSEHRLLWVEAELSKLTSFLESEQSEVVPQMKPTIRFNPNETLKTQLSQISAFKRPPKKRRGEDISTLTAKKQKAIDSLSRYAAEGEPDESDESDVDDPPNEDFAN